MAHIGKLIDEKTGREYDIIDPFTRERFWIGQETSRLARERARLRTEYAKYWRDKLDLQQLMDEHARQLELDLAHEAAE